MSIYITFKQVIVDAVRALEAEGVLSPIASYVNVVCEPPRDTMDRIGRGERGDLYTNAALVLGVRSSLRNPRELAEKIIEKIDHPDITKLEVAGPGFINIWLDPRVWIEEIVKINTMKNHYGSSNLGEGSRVNIEFVSANPTGPMHIGHCRGAVVGDALASLLSFVGYDVTREYYINDAGVQVDILATSVHMRYREALGLPDSDIPDGYYPGEYLRPLGEELAKAYGDYYLGVPEEEWLPFFREFSVSRMMDIIRADLGLLGIRHDVFTSEAELQASGEVQKAYEWLREHDLIYDGYTEEPKAEVKDWVPTKLPLFRSTKFGDDQDRPLKKTDGSWTYFGADIAYHMRKADSADQLINIWGADHVGTCARIRSAVQAICHDRETPLPFNILLVQMVQLMRGGKPITMSKRSGNFITVGELVEEVGRDAVRVHMLRRDSDTHMNFDFTEVVETNRSNPVFYIQYAHARICSTMAKVDFVCEPTFEHYGPEEIALINQLVKFPTMLERAALSHSPQQIVNYLYDLASEFHSYWHHGNVDPSKRLIVEGDDSLTASRVYLARAVGQVIRNGLDIIGVTALEEM